MEKWLTIGTLSERTGVAPLGAALLRGRGPDPRRPDAEAASAGTTATRSAGCRSSGSPSRSACRSSRSARRWRRCPTPARPTEKDWARLSDVVAAAASTTRSAMLERLRDRLTGCIGCGCLSLRVCRIVNPDDQVGSTGPGPRYVLDD